MTQDGQGVGARTRERILSAALPLFADHGYAGTSVRRVATASGVNVATLAYHFDDKDGLYRTCIERLYEELSQLDGTTFLASADPVEAMVRTAWEFARAHVVHVRLLHRHFLDRGRHHEVLADQWLDPLMARVVPLLETLRPDWTTEEHRLFVFTASHLIVRFVLDDPGDLSRSLAHDGDPDEALIAWVASLLRARLSMA